MMNTNYLIDNREYNNLQAFFFMNEQNQRLHEDPQSSESRPFTPTNKFIKRKLCQLQNKAYFFQGQINPLIIQNQKLKNQLTLLNKSLILSTDLLRSLLPIGSSETKKLKLQLANIQEICEMIKQDWHSMENQIEKKIFTIDVLQNKIKSNQNLYNTEFLKYKQQSEKIINQKQRFIEDLEEKRKNAEQNLLKTKEQCKKQIDEINEYLKVKIEKGQKFERQIQIFRREVNNRYREYEKSIDRLKEQVSGNLAQFEESKRNLRDIYEKLMSDKLQEQAEGFNLMLKGKDEEKQKLLIFYQEKEDQLQKYLNQKSQKINNLESILTQLKNQLQIKEQIIKESNTKISILHNQIQSNFTQISLLKESNAQIKTNFQLLSSKLSQNQQFYLKQLQEKTKKHQLSQQELNKQILKLQSTNQKLNQDLQQKSDKLKLTQKSLATVENRFNKKLQEEQKKWTVQKMLFEQKLQQLQSSVKDKQLKLLQQQKVYKQQINQFQVQKNNEIQSMINSHQKQLNLWKQDSQHQLDLIKKEGQRLLMEQRIKNNEEMQKLTYQWTRKIQQKEEQYKSMKQTLGLELQLKNSLISGLQSKVLQSANTIQTMKSSHQLQVTKMKNQSKKKFQEMQRLKQEQKRKLQEEMIHQILNLQTQMDKKSAQYQTTLKKIQNQMMNEINMLKSSSALEELESKYLLEMQKLQKSHQQQISNMQQKQKESQQSLIDQQKRRIQDLINQYEQDMTKLAKKLQIDIEKLNDQLMIEVSDHQITKMTRQQKIKYLSKKINDIKIISQQKQNKILELQLEIQEYKKEQQKMKQIIEQRVNQRKLQLEAQKQQLLIQCQNNLEKTKLQAHKKITQIETDRLHHTKNMYVKFNQMKQFHEQEMSRIFNKYSELQKMFSERPSRAEDLSKIKQLIEIRQKMDIEIKTYHKKVQHANEIVKYLNMELENYKDNYDMFGPGEQSNQKTNFNQSTILENPLQSIIKLKKINQQKIKTQGNQLFLSNRKQETYSPKIMKQKQQNQSPSITDFQIFPQRPLNESQTLIPSEEISSSQRLDNTRKSPQLLNKIKKVNSIDKSGEIVLNAENFLKLIRSNSKNNTPLYRDFKSNQKRAYRKSKPRRLNTLGLGSGEVYNLGRRGSIQEESNI